MQSARIFGNYVNFLAEENHLSHSDLSRVLGCSDLQLNALLKGRAYASFDQVRLLAELFIRQWNGCYPVIRSDTTQRLYIA